MFLCFLAKLCKSQQYNVSLSLSLFSYLSEQKPAIGGTNSCYKLEVNETQIISKLSFPESRCSLDLQSINPAPKGKLGTPPGAGM